MTMKTRLSTKGQVVIPREVRERHGWSAGTEIWIEDRDDHIVLRAAPEPPESTLDEIAGATGYEGPRKSLEEIKAGIAEGAQRVAGRCGEATPPAR